jgi:hypothetical protein
VATTVTDAVTSLRQQIVQALKGLLPFGAPNEGKTK